MPQIRGTRLQSTDDKVDVGAVAALALLFRPRAHCRSRGFDIQSLPLSVPGSVVQSVHGSEPDDMPGSKRSSRPARETRPSPASCVVTAGLRRRDRQPLASEQSCSTLPPGFQSHVEKCFFGSTLHPLRVISIKRPQATDPDIGTNRSLCQIEA